MNKTYIYVLNCCNPGIYEIEYDDNKYDSIDEIFDKIGLDADECSWIFSSKKLDVESIKIKDDESISN